MTWKYLLMFKVYNGVDQSNFVATIFFYIFFSVVLLHVFKDIQYCTTGILFKIRHFIYLCNCRRSQTEQMVELLKMKYLLKGWFCCSKWPSLISQRTSEMHKMAVCALTYLLYSCETWVEYRGHLDALCDSTNADKIDFSFPLDNPHTRQCN